MINNKQNTNFELVIPTIEIDTMQIFGVECSFKVLGFDKKNDYVPEY